MINEVYANAYCKDDISLIQNYDKAIADTTQTWECHHRAEILPCGEYTQKDLIKFGLYYHRPYTELIFLTKAEHRRLHRNGKKAVIQYLKEGEFIRKYASAREAARVLGIARPSITACCRYKRKSAGGFVWRYATNSLNIHIK